MTKLDNVHPSWTHLCTVLVDPRRLPVVDPGVLEHEPHVVHELPGVLELPGVELALDRAHVHRLLDDVEVVGNVERLRVYRRAERDRLRLLRDLVVLLYTHKLSGNLPAVICNGL